MIWTIFRKTVLGCCFAAILSAQPSITCENNGVVSAGQSITCTASQPVTWSLTQGSAGSVDAPTGVYTAPESVDVKHQFGGCQVFPNNNMLNTRIDSLPVNDKNAGWIGRFMTTSFPYVKFSRAFPFNIVDSNVPTESQRFLYTPDLNGSGWWVPPYPRARYQQGYFATESSTEPGSLPGTDRHLLSINKESCAYQEIYNRCQNQPNCKPGSGASGARVDLSDHQLPRGGTDAAGLPILATTLTAEELERARSAGGEVRHAIRFTMSNAAIHSSFLWPATANAYLRWCTDINTCAPYGAMFRLKDGFSFTSPTNNPYVPIILNTLKRYGIILGDGSGINMDLAVDDNTRITPLMAAAFTELQAARITSAEFEAVDQSVVRYAAGKYTVRPDTPYAVSDDFVEVVATPVDGGPPSKKLLSLIGVTVGVPRHEEYMIAGSTAQISAWVRGTTNWGLEYTMQPEIEGASVSASGLITAPSTLNNPAATVVRISSTAAPSVFTEVKVFFIPVGSDGKVRLATALNTGAEYFLDTDGNKWWARTRLNGASEWLSGYNANVYGYWPADQGVPGTNWPNNGLYRWSQMGMNDILHEFHIPNGHYKVTLKMSERNRVSIQKQHLESQGTVISRAVDVLECQGGSAGMPCDIAVPAMVTDGSLMVNIRGLGYTGDQQSMLSAILIEPNSDTRRIEIRDYTGGAVAYNQTRQLYTIGWGVKHSAVWELVEGPGSIAANGVYNAPVIPFEGDVRIRAVSTDDETITDEIVLHVSFGSMSIAASATTVDRGTSTQLTATIEGTPYSRVTWSSEGCGGVTEAGIFQAPLQQSCTAVVTATSIDDPNRTATMSITVRESPGDLKIDTGHGCYKTTPGWGRDTIITAYLGPFASTLSGFRTGGSSDYSTPVEGALPEELNIYQCYRSANGNNYFQYDLSRPTGMYRVRLMWAEVRPQKYQQPWNMTVTLNGETVLKNFDFTAAAGKAFKAYDQTFDVAVAEDGRLTIRFQGNLAPTNGQESASVNGIVVSYIGPLSTSSPVVTGTAELKGKTVVK